MDQVFYEVEPRDAVKLSYNQLVDQIQQNNAWSAEQAKRQMDFQERLFREANSFNRDEAVLNRAFQQESADKAMAFSSAENEENRAWQKMMSDTAHQREMADLKAAGLNPILAANNGASAGAGSAAMSAQAAGYGATSSSSPNGSKGDTDESGTMAIANLLGKMLDNQTEITKMITSAETARETAEMYSGATKYAAELGQIASDIASYRSSEASRYAAGLNYSASMSDPMKILGSEIADVLEAFRYEGISADKGAAYAALKAKKTLKEVSDLGIVKALDGTFKSEDFHLNNTLIGKVMQKLFGKNE